MPRRTAAPDRASALATASRSAGEAVADAGDERVFESVAELFALLSAPIRLRIISAVCQEELNVSQLLERIDTTQPNMSQHLATLHRCGVLARRREGTQIYYRLQNEFVATLCRTVCTQVAIGADPAGADAFPARDGDAR